MKRLFILIVLAVALTSNIYSQTRSNRKDSLKPSQAETVTNYEQQMREFVKRKDLKTFGSFIAEDFYAIFPVRKVASSFQFRRYAD